jgi:hypothetical protein
VQSAAACRIDGGIRRSQADGSVLATSINEITRDT